MATKNFRSTVLEPTSEFANGDKLRFTALATVGEVLKGSFSETTIGEDGVYSVDLQYGKHRIDYKPYEGCWRHFADVEVNADTLSTTLQDLALASVPVTEETVLVLQGLLADAEDAKEAAQQSAESASLSASSLELATSAEIAAGAIGKIVDASELKKVTDEIQTGFKIAYEAAFAVSSNSMTIKVQMPSTLNGNFYEIATIYAQTISMHGDATGTSFEEVNIVIRGLSTWGIASFDNDKFSIDLLDSNSTSATIKITVGAENTRLASRFIAMHRNKVKLTQVI